MNRYILRASILFAAIELISVACNPISPSIKYDILHNSIIRKEFDGENNLLTEEQLSMDSVNNGFYKKYNKNSILVIGKYLEGKKDSTWTFFDSSRNMSRKENWFDGKGFGEQITFYPKNKKAVQEINSWSFLNLSGKVIFNAEFDSNNNLVSSIGTPLYWAYNRNELSIGENIEIICFFSEMPGFFSELTIEELDAKQKRLMIKVLNDMSEDIISLPYAKKYYLEKAHSQKGKFKIRIRYVMKKKGSEIVVVDNLSTLEILVK